MRYNNKRCDKAYDETGGCKPNGLVFLWRMSDS